MPLLIDGYNLLHVTAFFGRGVRAFAKSREQLLDFLAAVIEPGELSQSCVIFDAALAPPGLPQVVIHQGLRVEYARDHASADELLAERIREHHHPRRLTVVSSDHRVQAAARRRNALAIDSDEWLVLIRDSRRLRENPTLAPSADKPLTGAETLSPTEVRSWLASFHLHNVDFERILSEEAGPTIAPLSNAAAPLPNRDPSEKPPRTAAGDSEKPPDSRTPGNPFPPGYGLDLLEGDG